MTTYIEYWAQDVLTELGHDYQDKNAVDWVLRWMNRNFLDPEHESVTTMSDECKQDFTDYIQKREVKNGKRDDVVQGRQERKYDGFA